MDKHILVRSTLSVYIASVSLLWLSLINIIMELLKRTIGICISLHLVIFAFGYMEMKNVLPHINNEFVNTTLQESMTSEIKSYIYRYRLRSEALKFRPAGVCYTEVPSHLLLCNKTLIRIRDGVCICNSIRSGDSSFVYHSLNRI